MVYMLAKIARAGRMLMSSRMMTRRRRVWDRAIPEKNRDSGGLDAFLFMGQYLRGTMGLNGTPILTQIAWDCK